ncbi:MAG: DUF2807 domain-containing protein [Prevotella sp.]|jgi:hypothetical protein|nr:DUF2807 domain-containing protein [Prevotella sp.]MCI1282538.1 DUF2807 domain-containing protein [Prevotella sp.]
MMKKSILLLSLCSLLFVSCGRRVRINGFESDNGPDTSVVRKVKNFEKIAIFSACDVHYTQGNTTSVRIVGNADDIKDVEVESDGTTLTLMPSGRERIFGRGEGHTLEVYITTPDLTGITVKGAGGFDMKGKLDTDVLTMNVEGAGDVSIPDVICDTFNITVKGAGDVDVERLECAESNVQLFGAGDIDLKQYNVKNSDISVFGVGNVDVTFIHCGKAKCQLFGVGDISLKGDVQQLQKMVKGTTGSIDTDELLEGPQK